MKERTSILIIQNGLSYHFAEVLVASDGSLEIAFPTIKENTGIVQSIQLSKQACIPIPVLLNNDVSLTKNATQYYISYIRKDKLSWNDISTSIHGTFV